MGQTSEFAASLLIVRQAASSSGKDKSIHFLGWITFCQQDT
jgi:hypothetical protein